MLIHNCDYILLRKWISQLFFYFWVLLFTFPICPLHFTKMQLCCPCNVCPIIIEKTIRCVHVCVQNFLDASRMQFDIHIHCPILIFIETICFS